MTPRSAALAIPALALALAGCATMRGSQDVPTALSPSKPLIGYDQALWKYGQPQDALRDNMTREEYRDYILDLYLVDIDSKYVRFKRALTQADRGSALAADLALLGLSGATALAGPGWVEEAATATVVATGARAAIDKRLFFDRTLPAVIAAMDTKRAQIKADIAVRRRLRLAQYTLGEAIADLTRLADAGNLFDGVGLLTAATATSKAEEEAELKTIVEGCSKADSKTRELNFAFIDELIVGKGLAPSRVAVAAKLLDLPGDPATANSDAVIDAFDTKFCGDAGKRAFIDLLHEEIAKQEGR